MLAETNEGYRNLIKLTSAAYLDGYYYKPRSDWELLERHHDGITATTGCLGGLVSQLILQGDEQAALEAAARFQDIFGREHFFVELQDHGQDDDVRVFRPLLDIARKLAAPLLATNDSHYTHKEDAEAHDALLCVQTGALKSDDEAPQVRRRRLLHQVARPRCATLFRELPDACDNTLLIAERADVEIEFGQAVLPVVPGARGPRRELVPPRAHDAGRDGALRRRRPRRTCIERIEYELDVIKSMGFSAYFLVVWDLVRYAKSRGIRVGPGRGSAAGSCVAYCLRIVDIDPIKYDLLFERFLNPGRKQMPDIDMDFDSRYRGEMIRYAAQKYGARPRRAGHHVLDDQGAGRGARRGARARLPVRRRRQDRQADAAADHGPRHAAARVLRAERRSTPTATRWRTSCAQLYDDDPDAKRVIDVARGLEGPAPPGRHPRRRGRDHARAAHRVPADPAQARARHAHRGRADRHAVRDARRRRPRPAEDGLPRPAQPRRHGDRARPHRAVHRASGPTSTTCRSTTRRRSSCCSAPTRSACSSSKAGRCARCCARWRRRRSKTSPP